MKVITMADIHARCEEVGDCLLWQGSMNSGGSPQVFVDGKYRQARRLVFTEAADRPIAPGLFPVMQCREPACLKYEHMRLMTHKQITQLAAKEGKFSTPHRRAAIKAGVRKGKGSKLTLEQVRAIRELTDVSGPKVAKLLGVHRSLPARIRRGEAWADIECASVFNLAGLMPASQGDPHG